MAKGSLRGNFQRAIESRNVAGALATARQLGRVPLGDALALCVLLAEKEPERFQFAAVRWQARYGLELKAVSLPEAELVLASLAGLVGPVPEAAAHSLVEIGQWRRLPGVEAALRPML